MFRENEYLIKSCIGSFEEGGRGWGSVMRNPPSPKAGISSGRVGLLGPSATLSFWNLWDLNDLDLPDIKDEAMYNREGSKEGQRTAIVAWFYNVEKD